MVQKLAGSGVVCGVAGRWGGIKGGGGEQGGREKASVCPSTQVRRLEGTEKPFHHQPQEGTERKELWQQAMVWRGMSRMHGCMGRE